MEIISRHFAVKTLASGKGVSIVSSRYCQQMTNGKAKQKSLSRSVD